MPASAKSVPATHQIQSKAAGVENIGGSMRDFGASSRPWVSACGQQSASFAGRAAAASGSRFATGAGRAVPCRLENRMLDKLKAMGAIAGLMKNQDKIKDSMERVKVRLGDMKLVGASGGGACRVTVNGHLKVLEVDLSPALVAGMASDNTTRVLAGNLVAEATNAAMAMAQRCMRDEIDKEAKALGMPELSGMLGDML